MQSNTAAVSKQRVSFASFSVEKRRPCVMLHMTEYRFPLSCDRLRELARCFAGSDSRGE